MLYTLSMNCLDNFFCVHINEHQILKGLNVIIYSWFALFISLIRINHSLEYLTFLGNVFRHTL